MDEELRRLEAEHRRDPADATAARRFGDALLRAGREADARELYRFKFQCPRTWSALAATEDVGRRHCNDCRREVFFARSEDELREHVRAGRCVAVPVVRLGRSFDALARDAAVHPGTDLARPCVVGIEERAPRVAVGLVEPAGHASVALERLAADDPEGALRVLDEAVGREPGASVLELRGRARARTGDLAGALEDLAEAERFDPAGTRERRELRGRLRALRGDLEGAREDLGGGELVALLLAALGGEPPPAPREDAWPAPLVRFLRGELGGDAAIVAAEDAPRADRGERRDRVAMTRVIVGIRQELSGDPERARESYERVRRRSYPPAADWAADLLARLARGSRPAP